MQGGMIGTQARQSLEHVLERAVRSRLVLQPGDTCTIDRVTIPAADSDGRVDGRVEGRIDGSVDGNDPVVALTISAMGFRYMLFLRFRNDAATAAYYARDNAGELRDTLLELGNLCCGAINQELVRHFPDLGMSTPYALGGHSLRHIDSLKPDYRADVCVAIADGVVIDATTCLFTRVPIDFHIDAGAEEATSNATSNATSDGELELF
ncbi:MULTISPECIES: hypothetical protein [unclassified Cupriavidus]|uniref:hypothetical protein n=1 Tax=unclassified Cupriavidus TaxID=2640874 RepID=UPI00313F2BB7